MGNPAYVGYPELRPTMAITDIASGFVGWNRQAEHMVGRNATPAASADEHRVIIGAVARLAIAGPDGVAPSGPGGLIVVDHCVDEVVVDFSPGAQGLARWQVDATGELADRSLDRDLPRVAQIGGQIGPGLDLTGRDQFFRCRHGRFTDFDVVDKLDLNGCNRYWLIGGFTRSSFVAPIIHAIAKRLVCSDASIAEIRRAE